ncbi:MAG TPA: exodeoxyribonuclease VII small subunit [Longimicrobiaceae bacterium]|nr:exodeoxyribonuclease VII small subunit [Longimicrobiaceae bacterium]
MTSSAAAPSAEPEWTFEAALERLGEIVERLEGPSLELDESLALFEEGVRLLRFADTVLEAADARVQQLVDEGGGSFRLEDLPEGS